MPESARLEKRRRQNIAQQKKSDGRRNDKECDVPQSGVQPSSDRFHPAGIAYRTRHRRQLCGRNGHAEQTHRERVQELGVCQTGHRARRQQTRQQRIDVGADLNHTTADKYRHKIFQYRANVFGSCI